MANCFRPQVIASLAVIALFSAAAMASPAPQGQQQGKDAASRPLAWAYAVQEPGPPPPPPTDDADVRSVPGSNQSFTMKQIRDTGNPVDWFPGDHPPMPTIVAHRRSPTPNPWIGSCGLCHYPNGKGRPENAGVAGLPAGYILEQLADFKNGARRTADPGKRNTATMAGNAAGITDEEAKAAADYFASMKMTPWIKVMEVETVPKNKNVGGFFVPIEGGGTEAARSADPGNAGGSRGDREVSQPEVRMDRVRAHGQRQERRGSGRSRRRGQDRRVRRVPWRGFEGQRQFPAARGPFSQLSRAPALRYPAVHSQRPGDPADAAGRSGS